MAHRSPQEFYIAFVETFEDGDAELLRPSEEELLSWTEQETLALQSQIDKYTSISHRSSSIKLIDVSVAQAPFGPIEGFRLEKLLGAAGQSTVYQARAIANGDKVAVKVYGANMGSGTERISADESIRAQCEIHSLRSMDHSWIVRLLGDGVTRNGLPFLVLEFIDGPSIEQLVRPNQGYPDQSIAELIHSLASAVQHIHEAGIIHRDIKPANVLLRGYDRAAGLQGSSPVLIDFGIAQVPDPRLRTTITGLQPGTVAYMAPEQFNSNAFGQVVPATDVRGIGLILFELLVGAPAFSGTTMADMEKEITSSDTHSLEKRLRGASTDLATICLCALQQKPRDRYPSAEALASDLTRFLEGEPIDARRPGWTSRMSRLVQRHYRPLLLASVIVAALISFAAFRVEDYLREQRIADVFEGLAGGNAQTKLQQVAFDGNQDRVIEASWPLVESYLHSSPGRQVSARAVRLLNQVAYECRDLNRGRSRECASRALELSKKFGFDRDDAPFDVRYEAARSAAYFGRILALEGHLQEGLPIMEEAARQFAALDPSAAIEGQHDLSFELALTWNSISITLSMLVDPRCDAAFRETVRIFRNYAQHTHTGRIWLVKSLSNSALFARTLSSEAVLAIHDEAVSLAEEYRDTAREARLRPEPEASAWLEYDLDYRDALGTALTNMAEAHEKIGNAEEAIIKYERALAIYRSLADAVPAHRDFPWNVAMGATDLGHLLFNAGPDERHDEAYELLVEAREWYDLALFRWPGDVNIVTYSNENRKALMAMTPSLPSEHSAPARDR